MRIPLAPKGRRPVKPKHPVYRLFFEVGAWLSLVEHLLGVQEVAGSSPVAPTNFHLYRPLHIHSLKQLSLSCIGPLGACVKLVFAILLNVITLSTLAVSAEAATGGSCAALFSDRLPYKTTFLMSGDDAGSLILKNAATGEEILAGNLVLKGTIKNIQLRDTEEALFNRSNVELRLNARIDAMIVRWKKGEFKNPLVAALSFPVEMTARVRGIQTEAEMRALLKTYAATRLSKREKALEEFESTGLTNFSSDGTEVNYGFSTFKLDKKGQLILADLGELVPGPHQIRITEDVNGTDVVRTFLFEADYF